MPWKLRAAPRRPTSSDLNIAPDGENLRAAGEDPMSCVCRSAAVVRVSLVVFALGLLTGIGQADDRAGALAIFHVGPKGRDTWSGTLAMPNVAGTDGPFATIV